MAKILKFLRVSWLMLIPFLPALALASETQIGMLRDLETIKAIFASRYAPADWKKVTFGWDLDTEIEKAKSRVLENASMTSKEYQMILKDFFNSSNDQHVQVAFYSTEMADLPFWVKGINGRYFFIFVDKERLAPSVFPFEEGDELVLFDGRPTAEVVDEIRMTEVGVANHATADAFAEMYLTMRLGMLGHAVPRGPVEIQVRTKSSNKLSSYQIIWDYVPERINSWFSQVTRRDDIACSTSSTVLDHPFFHRQMINPAYEVLKTSFVGKQSNHFLGAKESFVPELGDIWWLAPSTSHFHAYLFETADHKLVGYIRIPSYLGGDEDALADFASVIDVFEARAEALVIDQVNNPGGSLFYLYALASMLTDQPLTTPKHRMKISQSEIFYACMAIPALEQVQSTEDAQLVLGETYEGNPVTFQTAKFFLNYLYFLVDEWNAGRHFTQPYYLEGIDHINPHPSSRFTKPILFLTNALDMSGGDFLPAILQDNARALIFGERTAGAGGYMSKVKFPNLNGIRYFQITESIAERVDFSPLENLGVTPDVPYSLTSHDLQYGYQGYKAAVLDVLETILQ